MSDMASNCSTHLRPLWSPPHLPLSQYCLAKLANALGMSTHHSQPSLFSLWPLTLAPFGGFNNLLSNTFSYVYATSLFTRLTTPKCCSSVLWYWASGWCHDCSHQTKQWYSLRSRKPSPPTPTTSLGCSSKYMNANVCKQWITICLESLSSLEFLPAPQDVPQVEVTFDINANGILNVSASDMTTRKSNWITNQQQGSSFV